MRTPIDDERHEGPIVTESNKPATPRARTGKPGWLRRRVREVQQSDIAVDVGARLRTLYNRSAHPDLFDNLSCFCLFIGHGRSGSTLVGALLNAHRNVVLANELNAVRCVERGMRREHLLNHIYATARNQARHGSAGGGGYSYAVPGQWQDRHEAIRVIGDRKAGTTAIQLFRDPTLLARVQATVELPLRFVCVVRNPFDSITTTFRKTVRRPNEPAPSHLRRQIDAYFDRWSAVVEVHRALGDEHVIAVRHEDMVSDTRAQLARLCEFFGLTAHDDYLDACAGIVQRKPNVTRRDDAWEPELVSLVRERQASIPWLAAYDAEPTG